MPATSTYANVYEDPKVQDQLNDWRKYLEKRGITGPIVIIGYALQHGIVWRKKRFEPTPDQLWVQRMLLKAGTTRR